MFKYLTPPFKIILECQMFSSSFEFSGFGLGLFCPLDRLFRKIHQDNWHEQMKVNRKDSLLLTTQAKINKSPWLWKVGV